MDWQIIHRFYIWLISRVISVHCSRCKDCLSLGIPEYGVHSELVLTIYEKKKKKKKNYL